MEVGLHSRHGQAVQLNAPEEHKPEQELAQIHLLNMVEMIVLGLRLRAKVATPTIVLFMEDGVHSHLGQAVQLIAGEELKPEQELAQIHLLNTVEVTALDFLQRARIVTPMTAQVMTDIIEIKQIWCCNNVESNIFLLVRGIRNTLFQ